MADIFISYRRADSAILLEELTRLFQKVGWSVWSAPLMHGGSHLGRSINPELAASKCVVGLWSRTAAASRDVIAEFDYAHAAQKLIPVAIDDSWPPDRFRDLAIINVRGFNRLNYAAGVPQLLRGICQMAGMPDQYENSEELIADFFDSRFGYYKAGNIIIPAKVVTGVPNEPFSPDDVVILDCDTVHERRSSYPSIMRDNYEHLWKQVVEDFDLQVGNLRDNPLPRLEAWEREPEGPHDERGRLKLYLSRTSYFQTWATNVGIDVPIRSHSGGPPTTIRKTFCIPPYLDLSESVLSNNPGVEVVVISDHPRQSPERQVIIRRRGNKAAGYKGWYQVSASGHLSLGHQNVEGLPSPFQTAVAETRQEVDYALELKPEDYKLIGISLKEQDLHPSFYGYMVIARPAAELVEAEARDKYEGPKHALEFRPEAVLQHIATHRWIPQSALALIETLRAWFPRDRVQAAAEAVPVKSVGDFYLTNNRGRD